MVGGEPPWAEPGRPAARGPLRWGGSRRTRAPRGAGPKASAPVWPQRLVTSGRSRVQFNELWSCGSFVAQPDYPLPEFTVCSLVAIRSPASVLCRNFRSCTKSVQSEFVGTGLEICVLTIFPNDGFASF